MNAQPYSVFKETNVKYFDKAKYSLLEKQSDNTVLPHINIMS